MNWDNFLVALNVMWKGMIGIFIVTIVIIASIYFMGKYSDMLDKTKKDKNE